MSEYISPWAKMMPGMRIATGPLTPPDLKEKLVKDYAERAGIAPEDIPSEPIVDKYQALFLIALLKLSKTPEGLKIINNLGGKFIDGLFAAQKSMNATCAGSDITAWGAPVIMSALYERFGLVSPGFNAQFHMGLSLISGGEFIEDITSAIAGMFRFSGAARSENIQHIAYTEGVKEVTE